MVDGAAEGDERVLARLQGPGPAVSGEPPDDRHHRDEVREGQVARLRVPDEPAVGAGGVVRRQGTEAEAVQVGRLRIVVVQEDVLVALVGPFFRGLAAAADVEFLDDDAAGLGEVEREVERAVFRHEDAVFRPVEEGLAGPGAEGDPVHAGGKGHFGDAVAIGIGLVQGPRGHFFRLDRAGFRRGAGKGVRIDRPDGKVQEASRPGVLVISAAAEQEQCREGQGQDPFHSLMRQVRP